MSEKEKPEKISDTIEKFLEFLEECEIGYRNAYEEVGIEDKRCQDLLHMIEFSKSVRERNKHAARLSESRQYRRQMKNMAEVLEPVSDFVTDERNRRSINLLKELLGSVRKVESHQENATYYPRVEGDVIRD